MRLHLHSVCSESLGGVEICPVGAEWEAGVCCCDCLPNCPGPWTFGFDRERMCRVRSEVSEIAPVGRCVVVDNSARSTSDSRGPTMATTCDRSHTSEVARSWTRAFARSGVYVANSNKPPRANDTAVVFAASTSPASWPWRGVPSTVAHACQRPDEPGATIAETRSSNTRNSPDHPQPAPTRATASPATPRTHHPHAPHPGTDRPTPHGQRLSLRLPEHRHWHRPNHDGQLANELVHPLPVSPTPSHHQRQEGGDND